MAELGRLEQFWLDYMSGKTEYEKQMYLREKEEDEKKKTEQIRKQVESALGPSQELQKNADLIAPMSEEQIRVAQQQQQLADALRAQAEGKTPSLAQMQFQRALEQSQAAIQSQLASARGLSPAQAQRIAARQQAALGATGASQAAEMRLREQMAARSALATLLGQTRQGALGGYATAAELAQRDRALRAGLITGVQSREAQEGQQFMSGVMQFLPPVIQYGAKAIEAIGKNTSPSAGSYSQTSAYGKDSPEWWDYQPQAPSSDSTPGEPVFGGDPRTELAHGAEVTGRAKYRGDTRSNDTVPAMLSPGEIVLPRSVAQSPDAPDKAKRFVEAIKSKKKPSPKDYTQALMRLHELESRMDAMESLADMKAEEE